MDAPPLLPLASTDATLLADFLALRADLPALAQKHKRPLPTMIAWAAAPHIAQYIHAYLHLASISDQLKASDRRAATLDRIQALKPQDPTEDRRIAQSILRALPSTPRPTRPPGRLDPGPRTAEPNSPPSINEDHHGPARRQEPAPSNDPSDVPDYATLENLLGTLASSSFHSNLAPSPTLRPPGRTNTPRRAEFLLAAAGASG